MTNVKIDLSFLNDITDRNTMPCAAFSGIDRRSLPEGDNLMAPLGNRYAVANRGGTGRPSKYRPEYAEVARKLAAGGATDAGLGEYFGVGASTIRDWQKAHPEFSAALKSGKDLADEQVVSSLYERAVGFSFDSEEIHVLQNEEMVETNGKYHRVRRREVVRVPIRKHLPPDVRAAIFWLRNRRPDLWRDRPKPADEFPVKFTMVLDNPNNFQGDPNLLDGKSDGAQDGEEQTQPLLKAAFPARP